MTKPRPEKTKDTQAVTIPKTRGRPLKYKDVSTLRKGINKYFKECKENDEPLTITGLAIALGTTREVLMDYERGKHDGKDGSVTEGDLDYSDTIKQAKQVIEGAYEKRLIRRGNAGDIFALKNFGWSDKSEVEYTQKVHHISLDLGGDVVEAEVVDE